ncbi:WD40 repeat domain-containing protein [Thermomonospora amylolytica]|uniref:WD40 repeat domain-containing protein n=1 Tax=Thermomonospora amylolytica TaxID=1411117 RepID=UPI000E6C16D7|nr:PD40 domain-containing protein [Thermomonospora amylolytica]
MAATLSTPLMVSLARRIYQRCGGDPGMLLTGFTDRSSLEEHLISRAIEAAYEPGPSPAAGSEPEARPWNAKTAQRYLTFLAEYLHTHRERDLAWWMLGRRLLSPWATPVIGLAVGTVLMTVITVGMVLLGDEEDIEAVDGLGAGAMAGAVCAVLITLAWYIGGAAAPGRLSLSLRGSREPLRRGFVNGFALTAIPGAPVLAVSAAGMTLGDDWDHDALSGYLTWLLVTLGLAGVIGLALAVHNWLDAPSEHSARISPDDFVRQDRLSSLVGALAAGTVVGLCGAPAAAAAVVASHLLFTWITDWTGEPSIGDVLAARVGEQQVQIGLYDGLLIAGLFVLPGIVFALLLLMTRAWPRFLVVRLVLAARGHLPLRLMTFLADARREGLLRQSGGMYQFQHILLQEWLINNPPEPDAAQRIPRWVTAPRKVLAVVAVVTMAVLVLGLARVLPEDRSRATFLLSPAGTFSMSPDGDFLAIGRDDEPDTPGSSEWTRVWDVRTRTEIVRLRTGPVSELLLGPGGRSLVTVNDDGSRTWLWDVRSRRRTRLPVAGPPETTAFSADGQRLAIAGERDRRMHLWDVPSARPLPSPPTGPIVTGALNRDGTVLATVEDAAVDEENAAYTTRLWDTATGLQIKRLAAQNVTQVAFSPDDAILLTAGHSMPAQLWDVRSARRLVSLQSTEAELRFVPHGRALIFMKAEDVLRAWRWDRRSSTRTSPIEGFLAYRNASLAVSPDGRVIAVTAERSGTGEAIELRDAETGERFGDALTGHFDSAVLLSFSSDGKTLSSYSESDNSIRIWSVPPPKGPE